jgi:hypothetical protein
MTGHSPTLVIDDGGRHAAGYTGVAGDCATRAIAIATGRPYRVVYDELALRQRRHVDAHGLPVRLRSPRLGVHHEVWAPYLNELGWTTVPARVTPPRLRSDDLPSGRLVVELTGHLTAVIDGIVHDSFDPRTGTARVVSIWSGPADVGPLDRPLPLQLL